MNWFTNRYIPKKYDSMSSNYGYFNDGLTDISILLDRKHYLILDNSDIVYQIQVLEKIGNSAMLVEYINPNGSDTYKSWIISRVSVVADIPDDVVKRLSRKSKLDKICDED